MTSIYLDHAAATPMSQEVVAIMESFWSKNFYNPSANYLAARQTSQALERARGEVASNLGAQSNEIIFTAGATEANNLAIHGVMRQAGKSANLVVSAIEHESVIAPATEHKCRLAKVTSDGRVDLADVAKKIDKNTALVSIMYANNEIGTIQPLKEVAELVKQERAARAKNGNKLPIYLMSDAAQAANYLSLKVSRLGVDLMSLNGSKIYGPKQSGALYIKRGVQLTPLIAGGGQERSLRSGTENVAFDVGFARALTIAQRDFKTEKTRLQALQDYFLSAITQALPDVTVNGSLRYRLSNNLHITLPGQDSERLLFALDDAGIMAATGSACSSSVEANSHVLTAIGLSESDAKSSLRFTMGRTTSKRQLDIVIKTLVDLCRSN